MRPRQLRIVVHQGADFHWVAEVQRESEQRSVCDTFVHSHWTTVYTCWGTTKEEAVSRADDQIAKFRLQEHQEHQRDTLYRSTVEVLPR